MDLSEVMTLSPATVRVDETVRMALDVLHQMDVRHVPVVEGDRLVGMLSDRDIQGLALASTGGEVEAMSAADFLDRPAGDIMQSNVLSISASDEVGEAIDLMVEHKISALPVTDAHDRLVGIVSYVDLLSELRERV